MEPTTTPVTAAEPGNVLVLCPQEAHRDELARILQPEDFRLFFPPNHAEALARAAVGDAIILKVSEPGEEEYAFLQKLQLSPTGWPVPVLVIADNLRLEAALNCLNLGALDCLIWPVDKDRLTVRLRSGLARKRLADEAIQAALRGAREKAQAESLVASLIALFQASLQNRQPIELLEMMLVEAMRVTDCEGGTIYSRTGDDRLQFVLVRNDMLDINMGGSVGKEIKFEPLRLLDEAGKPNHKYVANHAALTGNVVSIADAYTAERFDFSGTRKFDANTGYRSKSFLTVPLKNHRQQVIGVLQLINARDPRAGVVVPFNSDFQPVIEALSALACSALEAYQRG
jgi:DNA-binding response OmpR family regulator